MKDERGKSKSENEAEQEKEINWDANLSWKEAQDWATTF